ncbi:PREDICTED: glutamate-rich protein 6B [Ceratotherium simum simum]|uniref:Glutamate-rich protein 6B n=1 Tax=Ceratotherium simum simum TaxID=73337 RepID=A0ABM1D0Y4_CERSS|nr:PREDICTED: glutamate-rich protein 6B [Ceratotherium simum simum]
MSTENDQSSGETSSSYPPTLSERSTQTFSSEEEDTEGDEESSKEESPFPEEEEYLEESEYLDEEEYLKGKEFLYEKEFLKEEKDLQKEKCLEDKEYLYEKLPGEEFKVASSSQSLPDLNARSPVAGPSWASIFFAVPPSISEPAGESPHYDTTPSTSFVKHDREFLAWQDQGTQTEWTYESKSASLKSRLKKEQESSTTMLKSDSEGHIIPEGPQEEENAVEFVSKESFWDSILNEHTDRLEIENFSDNLLNSSYRAVFRAVINEMAARNELEEDIDIPLTGHLESETRRKLGILLKKNFEKYRETISWILKKREYLLNPKAAGTYTFTFSLSSQPPPVEEPLIAKEVKKPRRRVRRKKKLEIDTEWVQSKTKVHEGDGKLILYPSGTVFQILFPDGSGQLHYPSGNLAMLILSTKESKFTYIILEDSKEKDVRALINNSGHATFYDENREIWLSLSHTLGYYFPKGKCQKAWNWWNLNLHVHAPPVQSISLKINQYIRVQIKSQDNIVFHFTHQKKHICMNLGTKYKFIVPEVLSEMKEKAILEVEFSSTAQKIQFLLGKMSRILNFLTASDLENFIKAAKIFLADMSLRKESCL